jgi:hypothetical protein
MTNYLIYLLTVLGIGYFITESSLVKSTREYVSKLNNKDLRQPFKWILDKFNGVINCIYCASFWIGIVVFYIMYWKLDKWTILYAFSCMGAIYVIKNIFNK